MTDPFEGIDVGHDHLLEGRVASGWPCPRLGCVSQTGYVERMVLPQLELVCVVCGCRFAVEL